MTEPSEKPKVSAWKLTLIEAFLTLLIIAVLAAILIPNFHHNPSRGDLTACKSNLKNLATALEMYADDHGGRYPKNLSGISPDYIKTIPSCPSGGVTYRGTFGLNAPLNNSKTQDYFLLECTGHNHGPLFELAPDYPKYNSHQGLIDGRPPLRPPLRVEPIPACKR